MILPDQVVSKFLLSAAVVSVDPRNELLNYQAIYILKPAPQLNKKHLQLSHFDKMKVSSALNVFSHSVAAILKLMVEIENWDNSNLTTSWFIDIIKRWFNLMSSRYPTIALGVFDVQKHEKMLNPLSCGWFV